MRPISQIDAAFGPALWIARDPGLELGFLRRTLVANFVVSHRAVSPAVAARHDLSAALSAFLRGSRLAAADRNVRRGNRDLAIDGMGDRLTTNRSRFDARPAVSALLRVQATDDEKDGTLARNFQAATEIMLAKRAFKDSRREVT
jgi:hypothetical protein